LLIADDDTEGTADSKTPIKYQTPKKITKPKVDKFNKTKSNGDDCGSDIEVSEVGQ